MQTGNMGSQVQEGFYRLEYNGKKQVSILEHLLKDI